LIMLVDQSDVLHRMSWVFLFSRGVPFQATSLAACDYHPPAIEGGAFYLQAPPQLVANWSYMLIDLLYEDLLYNSTAIDSLEKCIRKAITEIGLNGVLLATTSAMMAKPLLDHFLSTSESACRQSSTPGRICEFNFEHEVLTHMAGVIAMRAALEIEARPCSKVLHTIAHFQQFFWYGVDSAMHGAIWHFMLHDLGSRSIWLTLSYLELDELVHGQKRSLVSHVGHGIGHGMYMLQARFLKLLPSTGVHIPALMLNRIDLNRSSLFQALSSCHGGSHKFTQSCANGVMHGFMETSNHAMELIVSTCLFCQQAPYSETCLARAPSWQTCAEDHDQKAVVSYMNASILADTHFASLANHKRKEPPVAIHDATWQSTSHTKQFMPMDSMPVTQFLNRSKLHHTQMESLIILAYEGQRLYDPLTIDRCLENPQIPRFCSTHVSASVLLSLACVMGVLEAFANLQDWFVVTPQSFVQFCKQLHAASQLSGTSLCSTPRWQIHTHFYPPSLNQITDGHVV